MTISRLRSVVNTGSFYAVVYSYDGDMWNDQVEKEIKSEYILIRFSYIISNGPPHSCK